MKELRWCDDSACQRRRGFVLWRVLADFVKLSHACAARGATLDREESVDNVSTHGARWFMFLPLHLLLFLFFCFRAALELPGGTTLVDRVEIPALAELSAESSSPFSHSPTCRLVQKGLAKRRADARPLSFFSAGKVFFQPQAPHEQFAALAPLANTQTVPRYLSLQVHRL